jgi:hypothetical protein
MRLAPLNTVGPRLLDFSVSDDVQAMALGTVIEAGGSDYDTTANVANWGMAELVYVANASVAILPGTLCVVDKNFRVVASAAAATEANTGKPVFVALTHFAVGSTTVQYGWVLRRGVAPVRYGVAATAGRVFAGAAGVATPTAAAGVQILNAQCLIAAASTFTRTGKTQTGSSKVRFAHVAGMYVGQAISGTGIPGSSVISAIDPNGVDVVIGSAVGTPVNATASASVTVTLTNTGFGIVQLDYPFYQGQIT